MELSKDLALSIINSSEEFSIPFQSAYVWIGYAKKQNAKNKLVKNFQKGIDYEVFTDPRVNSKQKGLQGGRPAEEIRLTADCFKAFCMMAGTAKGKEVRKYFLECEKIAKKAVEVIPAQNTRIRELELEVELAKQNNYSIDRLTLLSQLHGVPTTMALLGRGEAVLEVDKPTVEIIDDRHNVKFSGQTLKQVQEYLNQKYGTNFKNGAAIKKKLKALNKDDLIAQTLRSISSDYIPTEYLEEVYKLLTRGNRQMLLGE